MTLIVKANNKSLIRSYKLCELHSIKKYKINEDLY